MSIESRKNQAGKKISDEMEVYCTCKDCRKIRIREAKEFTEKYGEFRSKAEILSAFFKGDTLPLGVLKQRAEAIILAKDLEEKKRIEDEKNAELIAQQAEINRIENERLESIAKENRLNAWRDEKQAILKEHKELTADSLMLVEEINKKLDVTDPVQLQEFGVLLQKSYNAINSKVLEIFNESKVKEVKQTVAILFEKLKNFDNGTYEEFKLIVSDFEILQSELSPLTIQSEEIIKRYNEQYDNIERMVENIDIFVKAGQNAIKQIMMEKKILLESSEVSDLRKMSKMDDYDSMSTRLSRRIEGLNMTKMQAISFVADLHAMKNIERSFVDDLSNVIYNIIPNWTNRMETVYQMKSISTIGSDLGDAGKIDKEIGRVNSNDTGKLLMEALSKMGQ